MEQRVLVADDLLTSSPGIRASTPSVLFITAVFFAWPVSAQPRFPGDVTRFIERREACDHFRGEAPYDAERRKFLEQQMQKVCAGTDKQLAELKKKYQGDTAVTTKLAEYEAEIEPPPRR